MRSPWARRLTGLCAAVLFLGGCAALAPERVDVEAVVDEAAALLEAGDPAGALARYDAALERRPEDPVLLGERALVALELGRTDAARDGLRSASAAAARAGDPDAAARYGDLLILILSGAPAWVDERLAAIEVLAEDEAAFEALEYLEALRADLYALAEEGDLDGAVETGEAMVALTEDAFGPLHRLSIDAAIELGNVYFSAGDPIGAETVLMFALEQSGEAVGPDHPLTLDVLLNLADLYEAEGRFEDALAMAADAAAGAERVFGPDAPRTVDLRLGEARRLELLGEYEAGAVLLEATCARAREALGEFHVRTADCLQQYGVLLSRGGDVEGARDVLADVVRIRSGVLGPEAPETLSTRLDMAALLRQAGEFESALAELDAVDGALTGPDGDALLASLAETRARVLFDLGRTAEAEENVLFAYELRTMELGPDDPLTLDALNLLGGVRFRAGDLPGAENAWRAVHEAYLARYGARSLNSIAAAANLGLVYETQGLYDAAEPLLRDAVELSTELLGTGHPQTLTSMNNLALLHESQGQFDRAEPLYLLPIEVLSSTLGEAHPRTIGVLNNLAYLYMLEENLQAAREAFERVLAGFEAALGSEHQDTLKALNNLGRVQRRLGDLATAEATISRALDARRRTLGPRHIDTLRSMRDLGVVHLDQGRLDEAETLLRETLDLDERVLGPQHPYTFEALNSLAEVLEAQQRRDDAFELRRTGFERRSEFLDRMLWVTSDNAREGYVRLHRPELDAYLSLLPEMPAATGGREALEVSLQRKGLLLQISSQIQQISALGLDPELASLAEELVLAREALAARTLAGPESSDPDAHLEAIRTLEARVEALQGELGRASIRYRESVAGITAQDLYDALPDDSSLVDYLAFTRADGTRGMLAGILHRDGAGDPFIDLVLYDDLDEVEAIVREYRGIIQDEGASDDEVEEIGNIAWRTIWEPITPYLSDAGPVYLVPDGVLNILPWDALVDADFRYLIETTDLRILSSPRELLPSRIPPAGGDFVVLAGPDYDTEEVAGAEVLAEVRGRRAARRGAGAPALVDEGASPGEAIAAAGTRGSRAGRFEAMRGISFEDLDSRSAVALASLRAASSGLRGLNFAPLPGAEREGELISEQVASGGG
ncbi:MAG: tetratricopeptide repeat protein, partial [Pseudomonadales bacterium]|nr:tetratricopeptide repeat protein [Pseudomonadales bacterium]